MCLTVFVVVSVAAIVVHLGQIVSNTGGAVIRQLLLLQEGVHKEGSGSRAASSESAKLHILQASGSDPGCCECKEHLGQWQRLGNGLTHVQQHGCWPARCLCMGSVRGQQQRMVC